PGRLARAAGREGQGFGARIARVLPGGPAARAGLAEGDIILALDDTAITGAEALLRWLGAERVDVEAELLALRGGEPRRVMVRPAERN
uniref:PDZ domain-containing protein n=1 Tax=Roseomonas rosulenta TaxID=2748667 RepID=UPI0018E05B36